MGAYGNLSSSLAIGSELLLQGDADMDAEAIEDTPAAEGRQAKQASTADAAEAHAEPAQPPALPVIAGLSEMQEPLERPLKRVALPVHAAMGAELQVRPSESPLG
jgi:hypothetical protein